MKKWDIFQNVTSVVRTCTFLRIYRNVHTFHANTKSWDTQ